MPYKKKTYKKNNYKKYAKYGSSAYTVAKNALTVALLTKKLLNVEFKIIDTQLTSQAISTTANIMQITNISQGTTDSSRDGSQIKLTKLYYQIKGTMNPSATSIALRIMIIHDKQTNSAIHNASDVLEDVTTQDAIVSPLNLNNKYRFKILYDKRIQLSNTGVNSFY